MQLDEQDIVALEANIETDKLVVTRIFGWEKGNTFIDPNSVPRYSSDICKATNLFNYLVTQRKPKYFPMIDEVRIEYLGGKWYVNLRGCHAFHESLSLAITRASLLYGMAYL